jgi:glutathione-regulated potassium-efflux system ancillary protein KefG
MTSTRKALVIYAHPYPSKSVVTKVLAADAQKLENVTFLNLYNTYPNFLINIEDQKKLVTEHSLVVFLFPIYWYSTPSLLKEWQDQVLEFGWAYGNTGKALHGKDFWIVASAGGNATSYTNSGYNRFSLNELLRPLEAMSHLCGMNYYEPFILSSARSVGANEVEAFSSRFTLHLNDYLNEKPDWRPQFSTFQNSGTLKE